MIKRRTFLQGLFSLAALPFFKPRAQALPAGLFYSDSEGRIGAAVFGEYQP